MVVRPSRAETQISPSQANASCEDILWLVPVFAIGTAQFRIRVGTWRYIPCSRIRGEQDQDSNDSSTAIRTQPDLTVRRDQSVLVCACVYCVSVCVCVCLWVWVCAIRYILLARARNTINEKLIIYFNFTVMHKLCCRCF